MTVEKGSGIASEGYVGVSGTWDPRPVVPVLDQSCPAVLALTLPHPAAIKTDGRAIPELFLKVGKTARIGGRW